MAATLNLESKYALQQHVCYDTRLHEMTFFLNLLILRRLPSYADFEIYWCLEDRIGGFYDADDYDRGTLSNFKQVNTVVFFFQIL